METLILMVALVILILLGMPIGLTMIVLPTTYILVTGDLPLSTIPYQMYEALARVPLISIPFFLLTGELMNSGAITERLLALSRELVGRFRGGLAQINIVSSMFFAGINGSAVADTAAVGSVLIPAMTRAGYPPAFSAAVTAIASTIGGIIPPSIVMILLASGMSLSVGGLFIGGILPGILIGLMLMAVAYAISVRRGYERYEEPFTLKALGRSFVGAAPALMIPVILLTGIVAGVFSATEAGAITALLAALIGAFIYRTLTWKIFAETVTRSARITGSVFIIIAAAGPFSWLLSRIGALDWLEVWLKGYVGQPLLFAFALIAFIFVAGMVMDAVANVIVLGPVLVKVCVAAGYHELQAGMVITVGFLLGTVTPPVGVCYFMASFLAKESLERVAIALIPFIAVEVLFLFLLLWIPGLSLWLPRLFGFA